jgi:ribosomal protein S18 acetylase RimI-like enzyme
MKTIKISLASRSDEKALAEWFKFYNKENIIRNRAECYTNHNFTVLAKENDKSVGVLQWYIKENPNAGVAEFEEIFVSWEHRGKGMGSMLVESAIKSVKAEFKKINVKPRKIFLFVAEDNLPARKLYEKYGFKKITNVADLFADKKDELFYSLDVRR